MNLKSIFWPGVEGVDYLTAARRRLLSAICVVIGFLGGLSGVLAFPGNYPVSPLLAVAAIAVPVLCAGFPVLVHLSGLIRTVSALLIAFLYVHLAVLSTFAGETHGQAINYFVVIPILACLLIGYRTGLVMGLVVAGTYGVLVLGAVPYWTGLTLGLMSFGLAMAMGVFQREIERTTAYLVRAQQDADKALAMVSSAKKCAEHEALHDALTGLPNRRYLNDILNDLRRRGQGQRNSHLAIAHIDLDLFKEVNDTFGHAAGDTVLRHCAEVLRALLRADDFVARIGGDEFVFVSQDFSIDALIRRADLIIERLSEPIAFEGKTCQIGVSIGIASANIATTDPHQVLQNADVALYQAKDRGRGRCVVFDDALKAERHLKKKTSKEIFESIENGDFIPVYQPQFSAVTFDLMGVEALARWQHPERGLLAPPAFLKTAEDLGVTPQIDEMIMRRALQDINGLNALGLSVPQLAVNVSSGRLEDPHLLRHLPDVSSLPFELAFELLETSFLDHVSEIVTRNLDGLRMRGIRLEIDDFGTGHASISSLMRIVPHRLKIDRSLVAGIEDDMGKRSVVHSIIGIGHTMHIEVLAEGVETIEQARILGELGCDTLQGFGLGKLMAIDDLKRFCEKESWRAIA